MNKLNEKYKTYSDEQLLNILANKEDYIEEAIQVIEELLIERNIGKEKIKDTIEEIQLINKEKIKIQNEPLGTGMKIFLILFLFIGIAGLGMIP